MKGDQQNVPLTPAADGADYAAGDARPAANKRARAIHWGLGLFFLINIIVLYVLHFADRDSSSSGNSGAVAGEFRSDGLSSSSASPQSGHAVSFGPDGQLRVGAGSTAYLDAAELPKDAKGLTAFRFAPLSVSKPFHNAHMFAYQSGVSPDIQSVVTTIQGDAKTKKAKIAAPSDKNVLKGAAIKGLVTLSDSTGVALYSAPNGASVEAYTAPIAISGDSIEVQQNAKVMAANNSFTNFVTRISDDAFAMVYYEPYVKGGQWLQRVHVGSVAKGAISFSDSLAFGKVNSEAGATTVGQPLAVFNTSDRFVVPWFAESQVGAADANGSAPAARGLCLSVFTFNAKTANLSASPDVCNADYQPAYFVETARLSNNRLAFVFADKANKYAVTVATVEFSEITGKVTFRGAFVFDDATGKYDFGAAFGFYPKPSVRVLSNNRLAIGFMNPSTDGKPSVKVLKFADDLSMTEVSPVLPISNGDFSVQTANPDAFGSIVLDMAPLETGVIIGYAGLWSGVQHQRVALVEAYGKPVGVVSKVDGSALDVAMTGTVELSGAKLSAGKAYYAATDGKLYTPSTTTDDEFVLANDNLMVLSKDSMVGVAVGDKRLFVSTSN
ncbi:hypothetical protein P43SY_006865 [Pythium insidiosum]|uniref:Uncharacterized protein n=1 Tax=Pythium insidiosum TaxID=114742 RepID=A0AAD5LNG7_PYTIN|nr:hypothetical protein P43SY_006865 [Pythium insidiosum]